MMDNFPQLETERLKLIKPSISAAEEIAEYRSCEEVRRYLPNIPDEYDEAKAEAYLREQIKAMDSKQKLFWMIQHNDDQRVIGIIDIHDIDTYNERGELGYGLHADYHNQGLIKEALQTVITYAFTDKSLHRLQAITSIHNEASQHVLQSLGFQDEGILKDYFNINNTYHDTRIYSVLEKDWVHG